MKYKTTVTGLIIRAKETATSLLPMLLLVIGVGLAAGAMPTSARAQQGLGIAAVVNEEPISYLDLETRIVLAIASSGGKDSPEARKRVAPTVLRALIDEKLMQQEIRRLEITVSSDEVARGIATIERQNGMEPGGFGRFLASLGIPVHSLASKTETEIGWNKLLRRVLVPKIVISNDEINDEIEKMRLDAGKTEYRIGEIFIPVTSFDEEEKSRITAEQVFEQLKNGASFARMARNFSASVSAATGGDLGWLMPEQMNSEIIPIVTAMQDGQVSLPVRSVGGYYIIRLSKSRTNPGIGGETMMRISQFHIVASGDSGSDEIAARKQTLLQAAGGSASCGDFEKRAAGFGSPMSGSLGMVNLRSLPDEMRAQLAGLPVGGMTGAFETGGGVAVLMVCERKSSGPDEQELRQQVANSILAKRLETEARSYLRDLKRNAFVDIRL